MTIFFGGMVEWFIIHRGVDRVNVYQTYACIQKASLASRLNGYMYSNGKSLNVALFILMANHCSRVTLQLLGVKKYSM